MTAGPGVMARRALQGRLDAVFQQTPVRRARERILQRQRQRQCLLLLAEVCQFLVQQTHFEHVVNAFLYFEHVERFADEVARARFEGRDFPAGLGRDRQFIDDQNFCIQNAFSLTMAVSIQAENRCSRSL